MKTTTRSLLAASLLLLGSAGICQAHSVTVTYQNILTDATILTPESNPVAETDCAKQTVEAAQEFSVITVTKGVETTTTYGFLFWDINGVPYTSAQKVEFQPMCGAANTAIALYIQLGGGGPCGEPCTDGVLAFSLNDAKLIPSTTPIASASGGWTSGSTVVIPPSTLVAKPEIIAPPPIIGYGKFKGWEVLTPGLPGPISTSPSLFLGPGGGQIILGLYGYPDPDPCQALRAEYTSCMAGIGPHGPLNCGPIGKALQACMAGFGE